MYNETELDAANNPYEIIVALNKLSHGLLGIFMLGTVFFVTFMAFKRYEKDTKECLLASSMITALAGIIFWGIQLISWKIVIWPILVMFASIMIYKFTD